MQNIKNVETRRVLFDRPDQPGFGLGLGPAQARFYHYHANRGVVNRAGGGLHKINWGERVLRALGEFKSATRYEIELGDGVVNFFKARKYRDEKFRQVVYFAVIHSQGKILHSRDVSGAADFVESIASRTNGGDLTQLQREYVRMAADAEGKSGAASRLRSLGLNPSLVDLALAEAKPPVKAPEKALAVPRAAESDAVTAVSGSAGESERVAYIRRILEENGKDGNLAPAVDKYMRTRGNRPSGIAELLDLAIAKTFEKEGDVELTAKKLGIGCKTVYNRVDVPRKRGTPESAAKIVKATEPACLQGLPEEKKRVVIYVAGLLAKKEGTERVDERHFKEGLEFVVSIHRRRGEKNRELEGKVIGLAVENEGVKEKAAEALGVCKYTVYDHTERGTSKPKILEAKEAKEKTRGGEVPVRAAKAKTPREGVLVGAARAKAAPKLEREDGNGAARTGEEGMSVLRRPELTKKESLEEQMFASTKVRVLGVLENIGCETKIEDDALKIHGEMIRRFSDERLMRILYIASLLSRWSRREEIRSGEMGLGIRLLKAWITEDSNGTLGEVEKTVLKLALRFEDSASIASKKLGLTPREFGGMMKKHLLSEKGEPVQLWKEVALTKEEMKLRPGIEAHENTVWGRIAASTDLIGIFMLKECGEQASGKLGRVELVAHLLKTLVLASEEYETKGSANIEFSNDRMLDFRFFAFKKMKETISGLMG